MKILKIILGIYLAICSIISLLKFITELNSIKVEIPETIAGLFAPIIIGLLSYLCFKSAFKNKLIKSTSITIIDESDSIKSID